jgi:hypothetical protein
MLVNVRLSYILVDVYHYSSCGQVILTVSLLALLHFGQTENYTKQQRQNKTVQDFHYYNTNLNPHTSNLAYIEDNFYLSDFELCTTSQEKSQEEIPRRNN